MLLSEHSIKALATVITGDPVGRDRVPVSPYRTGPALITFFNQFRVKQDSYASGFPSRWVYAEESLEAVATSEATLKAIIKAALDPRPFIEDGKDPRIAADYLNGFLTYDGFKVVDEGRFFTLAREAHSVISVQQSTPDFNDEYVLDQVSKCRRKLDLEDYDGAITNARTLLESALVWVEQRVLHAEPYDGDLLRLYKRVQTALNLEPGRKDISDPLKQVLSGLVSIVGGLGAIRNKMSDAHSKSYKPSRHHATLAVNAASTLVDFLLDSYRFQLTKGIITGSTNEKE